MLPPVPLFWQELLPSSALRDARGGEAPSREIPLFPLPVYLLVYLWGQHPFGGVVSSAAGQCLLEGALHKPGVLPAHFPAHFPAIAAAPQSLQRSQLAMSDFSCDVFVGSPAGCRQPSQTLT